MPKELCHWIIARRAAQMLDAKTAPRSKAAILACPEAFLLGAVSPDAPFYVQKQARIVAIARKIHGHGASDAYAPVKRAVATGLSATAGNASPAIALAAGALCHIAGDSVFHPAVFYFTGFASHPDADVRDRYLFRHRAFEAAMDLRVFSEHGRGIEPKLGRILQRAAGRADAEELLAALARFYATEAPAPSIPDITTILRKAGGTQRLFFSTPVRLLARALHLRMAGKNADASALFYTNSSRWLRDFASPRPFRDPISGVGGTFETNRFLDEAAQLSVANFARLERALDGDAQAFPHPGPSLESGHPLDADQRMRHCDPELLRS